MLSKRIRKEMKKNQEDKSLVKERKYWSGEEDQILQQAVQIHGSNWKIVAEYLKGRNASQCAQRWKRVKPDNEEKNQKWTIEEDQQVKKLTNEFKFDWKVIARFLPNRTGRQIRERYINHLDPSISNKAWSQKEDLKIWTLYQKIGSRWSEMAKKLKGRPENMIKNRFYGYIRKTYAKLENPYYIVPIKNRKLKEEDENDDIIKIEQKEEEDLVDIKQEDQKNDTIKNEQNSDIRQLENVTHFRINPIFSPTYSNQFAQTINTNLQEYYQFQTFQKFIQETTENKFMKYFPQLVNNQQGDKNINLYYNQFIPFQEQRQEENLNFIKHYQNFDYQSKQRRKVNNVDQYNNNSKQ